MNKKIFLTLLILITITFSIIAFDPAEIVIIGPQFHEQSYFIEELNEIESELGIKINYQAISDPESFIIDNPNHLSTIAIIPNAQGVANLAERKLIVSLHDLYIDDKLISHVYSDHLNSITTHNEKIYAGWIRLFPNSLIWYDVSKFQEQNITFESFDSLMNQTQQIADEGISPWCANSESSASTGWIQTNWFEDILLTNYGPKIYDEWSNLKINASNVKIYQTMKILEEFIFYENHIFNGPQSIVNNEYRNLPKVLLDDTTDCFLSWSGHYFRYYIPKTYIYLEDFAVTSVPKINFEDFIVGVGDNIVLTKDDDLSRQVISKLLSKNFGEIWSSYQDSEFISANKNFDTNKIKNELTKYEHSLVHEALEKDLFRYDASEIMARPIGSSKLWVLFREYIQKGPENLVILLNNLDKEI